MENPIKDNRIVNDKTFALRFHSFVEKTQVNDLMSEEEKEYLLHVAEKLIKYQAETVSTKAEADYLTNNNIPHSWEEEESEEKVVVGNTFKIKESDYVAGDIVLWDGEKKVVASQDGFSLPTSGYIPIGVVVIPTSHMDDGKARMMALRWMSCEDPENGSLTYQNMVWGTAISGLTNFFDVPVISSDTNQVISGSNDYGYLPSDDSYFTGDSNPKDEGTRWYFTDNDRYIASPYAPDGTPNPLYRATEYSGGTINNALSYFDGRHQTDVILEARGEKDYDSWKPDSGTPEDFPAASCCDMYHTVGTSQGDWYLPSCAELGYVVARLGSINDAITKVNGMQKLSTYWAWSSSEFDSFYVRSVIFEGGYVDSMPIGEGYIFPVVAFAFV